MMHPANKCGKTEIGNSIYQKECERYYSQLREIHNSIFTSNKRKAAEKDDLRYKGGNVPGIKNLYSFIDALALCFPGNSMIKGVDYGCGSHYFVDDMRKTRGWDVVGFDADISAIRKAQRKYKSNADRYVHINLLEKGMPLPDASQNFVFCNAVIQHFSDDETRHALNDMQRVLKKGGLLLIIFKRQIENWPSFSIATGLTVNLLDQEQGKIEIEDETMENALRSLSPGQKANIDKRDLAGMRLFHFYKSEDIVEIAQKQRFMVDVKARLSNGSQSKGIFTYLSGKNIPNAAIFFRKK